MITYNKLWVTQAFRFGLDALPRAHVEHTNRPDRRNERWKNYAEAAAAVGWVGAVGPPSRSGTWLMLNVQGGREHDYRHADTHPDTVQDHVIVVSLSPQYKVERAGGHEGRKTTFFVVRCI